MTKLDYYNILGVSKKAEEREIKKAYKRLAIKFHPDRNPGNTEAEAKFKEIKQAYEILTDPQKRAAYDNYGHAAFDTVNNSSSSDFSDIFGDVFGDIFGNNRKNNKGDDLCYNMELSLEEAVRGIIKEIRIPGLEICNYCYGKGTLSKNSIIICSSCRGQGSIHMRQGFFSVQQTCPSCHGEGKIIKEPCYKCRGNGKIEKYKTLSIKIPAGVDNGDRIRLPGKGKLGSKGASNGDLYIQIQIYKHPIFRREENDLYCEVPINFSMAALGGEIEVPTLDGKVKLKIPNETQTGRSFRIRGKGVRSVKSSRRGDLLCKVVVETPVKLNDKQKYLLKELGDSFNSSSGNKNSPRLKTFLEGVKKFFDDLTS